MADDAIESMSTGVAQEQNEAWELKLNTYVNDRRPPEMSLSGGPAAAQVQPALDKFVTEVGTMFDDNLDLGLLVHAAMVGQRQLVLEVNES